VNGGVNSFRAKAATTSSTDAIASFENTNGTQLMLRGNGSVGLGTANPVSLLTLVGLNAAFTFGTPGAADSSSFSINVVIHRPGTLIGKRWNRSRKAQARFSYC